MYSYCLRALIKIGTIQRRLAWTLRKDDTHYREVPTFFFAFFWYLLETIDITIILFIKCIFIKITFFKMI